MTRDHEIYEWQRVASSKYGFLKSRMILMYHVCSVSWHQVCICPDWVA
jgi:hypothetical protein